MSKIRNGFRIGEIGIEMLNDIDVQEYRSEHSIQIILDKGGAEHISSFISDVVPCYLQNTKELQVTITSLSDVDNEKAVEFAKGFVKLSSLQTIDLVLCDLDGPIGIVDVLCELTYIYKITITCQHPYIDFKKATAFYYDNVKEQYDKEKGTYFKSATIYHKGIYNMIREVVTDESKIIELIGSYGAIEFASMELEV